MAGIGTHERSRPATQVIEHHRPWSGGLAGPTGKAGSRLFGGACGVNPVGRRSLHLDDPVSVPAGPRHAASGKPATCVVTAPVRPALHGCRASSPRGPGPAPAGRDPTCMAYPEK